MVCVRVAAAAAGRGGAQSGVTSVPRSTNKELTMRIFPMPLSGEKENGKNWTKARPPRPPPRGTAAI